MCWDGVWRSGTLFTFRIAAEPKECFWQRYQGKRCSTVISLRGCSVSGMCLMAVMRKVVFFKSLQMLI